jgi:hypothetical protein
MASKRQFTGRNFGDDWQQVAIFLRVSKGSLFGS